MSRASVDPLYVYQERLECHRLPVLIYVHCYVKYLPVVIVVHRCQPTVVVQHPPFPTKKINIYPNMCSTFAHAGAAEAGFR